MTAAYAVTGSSSADRSELPGGEAPARRRPHAPGIHPARPLPGGVTLSQGAPGRHDTAMAKSLASDAADLAAKVALQVHGAIGYTWSATFNSG